VDRREIFLPQLFPFCSRLRLGWPIFFTALVTVLVTALVTVLVGHCSGSQLALTRAVDKGWPLPAKIQIEVERRSWPVMQTEIL
jgi:hypothetical protein